LKSICTDTGKDLLKIAHRAPLEKIGKASDVLKCVAVILFLEVIHIIQTRVKIIEFIDTKPIYIRWSIYYLFVFLLLLGSTSSSGQFIYFQF